MYQTSKKNKLNRNKKPLIAIIGCSGRFPGADNTEKFWNNLLKGKEAVVFYSKEELSSAGIPEKLLNRKDYIKAASKLENIDYFDAEFFNYSNKDAQIMDPQIRMLHEVVYEALENAGYSSKIEQRRIGLYLGASRNYYWEELLRSNNEFSDNQFSQQRQLNENDWFTLRLSYNLGLKGPSIFVNTTCSTAITSIHLAVGSLINGECDLALAGGASIKQSLNKAGYLYESGNPTSTNGHCSPFDASAKGTVWSDALGVVVLKLLDDAVNDNDNIMAVVRGSAVNNDGGDKANFSAPSINGQKEVIKIAIANAEIDPQTITYIEAHGTGTKLGDPAEVEALTQAFNTKKKQYCAIGSVKSNVGHAGAAAGVVGFIKTIFSLQNKLIPPSINFKKPNSIINFKDSPFYVVTKLTKWKRISPNIPLRAGVSSFGVGGTNAHVVLEEAPEQAPLSPGRKDQLIILSAKTKSALETMTNNLVNYIRINKKNINIADLAYTLQVGRGEYNYRKAVVTENDAQKTIKALKIKNEISFIDDTISSAIQADKATVQSNKILKIINLENRKQYRQTLIKLADFWQTGALVDWKTLHRDERRQRIPLPTYPFERKRYWPETKAKIISKSTEKQLQVSRKKINSDITTELVGIWQNILGLKNIDTKKSFFDIGGNSLSAIRIIAEIKGRLDKNISMNEFFKHPKIYEIAEILKHKKEEKDKIIKKARPKIFFK